MNVDFTTRFEKQLDEIKNEKLRTEISKVIKALMLANSLMDVPNVKKLRGYKTAYRIRVGNYRMGFIYANGTIIFSAFAHRKNIYRDFP